MQVPVCASSSRCRGWFDERRIQLSYRRAQAIASFRSDSNPSPSTWLALEQLNASGMGEVRDGYYYVSSAPAVVNGRVVLGGFVLDGQMIGEPSGVMRAFDASDGRLLWAWDMNRPDAHGEPPEGQAYSRGTANSWAPTSGDEALGLVYEPVGNATPDFWGAYRLPGSEKYSSSVVALDLSSGTVRWHYQTVHHDLWDYDVAAQPPLIDLKKDGERVSALLLATKRGQIFLLDRRTGKLLAAVEERPVPQGAAPGDFVSPTQPFSTGTCRLQIDKRSLLASS